MRALIEADEIAYASSASAEHAIYRVYARGDEDDGWIASFRYHKQMTTWIHNWNINDEDITIIKEKEIGSLHMALYNTRAYVNSIIKSTNADSYCLYFSGENNIRYKLATTWKYKDGRGEKPHYYKQVKDYLQKNYNYEIADGLEADDFVIINAYKCIQNGEDYVVVSKDKDLRQVRGKHYIP